MTTVNELREKRATAWNAAKAFLESRRTDKGTLTAEDDATYTIDLRTTGAVTFAAAQ